MTEFPAHVRAAARLHTDRILRLPNVVGVGVARRRVGGAVTDEPAVLTYVSRKLPLEALRLDERVPRVVDVDGEEVGTDVVEIGVPRFVAVDTAAYRPLRGGCQIGTAGGAGTAGAVMYDRRDSSVVLLTNNHVLTVTGNPTTLPPNQNVHQPAGGSKVGVSKRIVPMFRAPLGAFDYTFSAPVDAGIVEVDDGIAGQFDVVEIAGKHPFVALPAFEGLEVVRRGYRTQLRTGTVEAVDMTITITASNGDRLRIGPSVFSIRSPERLISAMKGDSGSLVVDAAGGAARGLVFASDEQSGGITWACDLITIMALLEIETPCTGARNAMIRRAVRRRFTDSWAAAQQIDAAGGTRNAFVDDVVTKVHRFTHAYLPKKRNGSTGSTIGYALARLGPDLAAALTYDEEAAGLFDRAFGDWLVTPTVFDMLEYRFPRDAGVHVSAAFGRIRDRCRPSQELDLLERIFTEAAGRSMREVLDPGEPYHDCPPEPAEAALRS
jgi:hypothetical protein